MRMYLGYPLSALVREGGRWGDFPEARLKTTPNRGQKMAEEPKFGLSIMKILKVRKEISLRLRRSL